VREILFRGKRLDNGKWVYGYLYITHTGEYEIGSYNKETNIEKYTYVVDPATVGQFTGLSDKHSEKIFEGDIVCRTWIYGLQEYKVCYDLDTAGFIGVHTDDAGFTTFNSDGDMFEVIGNIHDNPELLGDGENNV